MDKKMELFLCHDNFTKNKSVCSIKKYGGTQCVEPLDLSIVIPTYKRTEFLKRAVNSIIKQKTELNYEIIIVDNEYYDIKNTELEIFFDSVDSGCINYYQNERNIGQFGNWNRCLELAKSKWVAMLHDDDYLLDDYFDKVEVLLRRINTKKDIGLIKTRSGSKHYRCGLKKRMVEYNVFDISIMGPIMIGKLGAQTCGTLMNREAVIRCGGFCEDFWPDDDAYLVERLLRQQGFKVYRTSCFYGIKDFEDATTYKYEACLRFAKNYKHFVDYYGTWNRTTHFLYRHFLNEINYIQYKNICSLAKNNENIRDKEDYYEQISKIIGETRLRPLRYLIYRSMLAVHSVIKLI